MADLAPEAFVGEYLVGQLNASGICVGEDFRFGQNRRGDVEMLRSMASMYGLVAASPTAFLSGGNRVSSSSFASSWLQVRSKKLADFSEGRINFMVA